MKFTPRVKFINYKPRKATNPTNLKSKTLSLRVLKIHLNELISYWYRGL